MKDTFIKDRNTKPHSTLAPTGTFLTDRTVPARLEKLKKLAILRVNRVVRVLSETNKSILDQVQRFRLLHIEEYIYR
jgi:hypothetical protein